MINRNTTDSIIINTWINHILDNVGSFIDYVDVRTAYWNIRAFEYCSISDKISDDIWSMIE